MAFARQPPPILRQGSAPLCWACATSSWTRVTAGVNTHTVPEMIALMRSVRGAMNPDQSLTAIGVRRLAVHFALRSDPSLAGSAAGSGPLTEAFFEPKLRAGYVLFFYRTPTPLINHMILVYACYQFGFRVMDPFPPGRHASRSYRTFTPPMYLALWRP